MPTTDDMRNVLDIQDQHIWFDDGCVEYREWNGQTCKWIHAKLTYRPQACAQCGAVNHDYSIYKNGTQSSRITMPMTGIYPTYLLLKKQRFKCTECGETFVAQTSLVKENCFISNTIRAGIVIASSKAQSVKDISNHHNVSEATTQRLITEEAKQYHPYYHWLPKNLSFDEFSYRKSHMAFEYINAGTGQFLDILPSRKTRDIKAHFLGRYSLKSRKKVETITVDMNAGYIGLIPAIFPQAKIIIDRFHLIQLLNRSMNKTRIQVTNQFNTSKGEDKKKYRRLKRYWQLFLKKEMTLSYTEYHSFPMFGLRLEPAILAEMLDYNPLLRSTYRLYQDLMHALRQNDIDQFQGILAQNEENISETMKTSLKTLRKHLPYIQNTLASPYSNGRLEGINNKIKVLKRVAYGYRNFFNYKSRILLHFNIDSYKIPKHKNISEVA